MFINFRYEDYKNPRAALYITLARTFLLSTIIMGVLLAFWIVNTSEDVSAIFFQLSDF